MTETVVIQLITSLTTLGISIITLLGVIHQRKAIKRTNKKLEAIAGPLANHSDTENHNRITK